MNTDKMEKRLSNKKQILLTILFISLTYLWTGSSYMSWTSHLTPLTSSTVTYLATEAGGCVTQIIGLWLFSLLLKQDIKSAFHSRIILFIMILDGLSALPVFFSREALMVLIWGLIMNLFHGAIAAYYIARLSYYIPKNRRALCFGIGYAFGSLGSYPLSLIDKTSLFSNSSVWFVYAFFILLSCFLVFLMENTEHPAETMITSNAISISSRIYVGIVIILLGLATQLLFFFPAKAYIDETINLEFAHMFYAVGLVIAALVNDKKRSAGLILALLSLCFPFLSLSLYQATNMLSALTIIGKIVTGFYAVYRVVVFTDLYDNDTRLLFLAPMGLLCGRIGETCGATLGFIIGTHHIFLTITTSTVFVVTVILVFPVYVRLYSTKPATTAEDRSNRFYAEYELSSKEQQVFALLIEGKTNKEIADVLFISENTVKFHVRNILKKTACQKRTDIIHKFQSYS